MQPLTPEPQGAGLGAPPFSGVFVALVSLPDALTVDPMWRDAQKSIMDSQFATNFRRRDADSQYMITNQLQNMLTIQRCSVRTGGVHLTHARVPTDVVDAAVRQAMSAPEFRAERIEAAKRFLAAGPIDSTFLASMIVARITAENAV